MDKNHLGEQLLSKKKLPESTEANITKPPLESANEITETKPLSNGNYDLQRRTLEALGEKGCEHLKPEISLAISKLYRSIPNLDPVLLAEAVIAVQNSYRGSKSREEVTDLIERSLNGERLERVIKLPTPVLIVATITLGLIFVPIFQEHRFPGNR